MKIQGYTHVCLYDENGNIKQDYTEPNTITNFMDKHVADQMSDSSESQISYMALGSGTGQTASSVDLSNYISDSMISLSGTTPQQQAGGDDNDVLYSAYWGAGVATGSIKEAGIFQVSGTTRNSMCAYNDEIRVNKGTNDTLKIDWTITYGSS